MCIEDSYGLIEDEDQCLVFDSADEADTAKDSQTISEVLQSLGLLETTELDLFLSMSIEVVLKVQGEA